MYKGYNSGVEDGVRGLIKLLKREFVLMEKRSDGILLNKGQVDFLKTYLSSKANIKLFIDIIMKSHKI